MEEMFSRKLAPILLLHVLSAYVVGSEIYGFQRESNTSIVVGLVGLLVLLAHYAKEDVIVGARDMVLQGFQIKFALISGGLGYSKDYAAIFISILMLSAALIICYVRVTLMKATRTQSL